MYGSEKVNRSKYGIYCGLQRLGPTFLLHKKGELKFPVLIRSIYLFPSLLLHVYSLKGSSGITTLYS